MCRGGGGVVMFTGVSFFMSPRIIDFDFAVYVLSVCERIIARITLSLSLSLNHTLNDFLSRLLITTIIGLSSPRRLVYEHAFPEYHKDTCTHCLYSQYAYE